MLGAIIGVVMRLLMRIEDLEEEVYIKRVKNNTNYGYPVSIL